MEKFCSFVQNIFSIIGSVKWLTQKRQLLGWVDCVIFNCLTHWILMCLFSSSAFELRVAIVDWLMKWFPESRSSAGCRLSAADVMPRYSVSAHWLNNQPITSAFQDLSNRFHTDSWIFNKVMNYTSAVHNFVFISQNALLGLSLTTLKCVYLFSINS